MAAPQRPGMNRAGSSIASINKTIVLVTGGNTGIGLSVVKTLATARPDYQILLASRDIKKGEEAAASIGALVNVNPIQLDITDDTSVEHAFKAIEQHFGRLDILINNAGTAGADLKRQREGVTGAAPTPRETWTHVMNVNVVSTAVLTDKLTPLLQASKKPRVIFVSSSLGSLGLVAQQGKSMAPQVPWYNSSKAALNMLTLHYATSYPGWKVNAVNPGLRATGIHDDNVEGEGDVDGGAVGIVRLATEGDGATGTFVGDEGAIPW